MLKLIITALIIAVLSVAFGKHPLIGVAAAIVLIPIIGIKLADKLDNQH